MTRNEQVAWFPAGSVAVQETVVVPLGKKLPEGGTQTTLGVPHPSLAATWKVTISPGGPVLSSTTSTSRGQLIVGGVESRHLARNASRESSAIAKVPPA